MTARVRSIGARALQRPSEPPRSDGFSSRRGFQVCCYFPQPWKASNSRSCNCNQHRICSIHQTDWALAIQVCLGPLCGASYSAEALQADPRYRQAPLTVRRAGLARCCRTSMRDAKVPRGTFVLSGGFRSLGAIISVTAGSLRLAESRSTAVHPVRAR